MILLPYLAVSFTYNYSISNGHHDSNVYAFTVYLIVNESRILLPALLNAGSVIYADTPTR
jgi:hypothetical protein